MSTAFGALPSEGEWGCLGILHEAATSEPSSRGAGACPCDPHPHPHEGVQAVQRRDSH